MKKFCVSLLVLVPLVFAVTQTGAAEVAVELRFSTSEVSIIREFYEKQQTSRNPRKKNRNQLPPGIAKNLGRGKPLPPGIAKQMLPNDLAGRLPPVSEGYERVVVDGKVLLVEIATQVIHDILTDVILH